MSSNHYERQRKQRISAIEKMILDQPGQNEKKLVAEIVLEYGVQKKTARDYLDVLEQAGVIENRSGEIHPKERN